MKPASFKDLNQVASNNQVGNEFGLKSNGSLTLGFHHRVNTDDMNASKQFRNAISGSGTKSGTGSMLKSNKNIQDRYEMIISNNSEGL